MSDAQLPATPDESFAAAVGDNFVPAASGGAFLRFTKFGEWLSGDEPVDGLTVVIHSKMIQHGWRLWKGDGHKQPQDSMCLLSQTKPAAPESFEGTEDGKAKTFYAKPCYILSGMFDEDDAGPFEYSTDSKGGVGAVENLIREIVSRARTSAYFFPRVRLEADHYTHSTYGKIFTPVFEIVEWCDINGTVEGTTKELPPGDDEADTGRRRRRRKAA